MRAMSGDEGRSGAPRHGRAEGPSPGVPQAGTRVVVRYRLTTPDPRSGAHLTDVVGDLVEVSDDALVVAARRGEVRVPTSAVEVVHEVPPRPSRRGAPHRALSVEDLERVMVGAWPAMETAPLGDWLLRASRGFTNRANSVMTAGSPGLPLAAAVDEVERWYAARGLPTNLSVAGPVGFDSARDPLVTELLRRGYRPRVVTRTLTAATDDVVASTAGTAAHGLTVRTGEDLDEAWLAAYRGYRDVDEVAARAVLTGSPAQDLARATAADGTVVGIGRLGVASAWAGVAAMWVAPHERRRGVASAVLGALAERARARGIRSLHLQTDTDNPAALQLYGRHGFTGNTDAYYDPRNSFLNDVLDRRTGIPLTLGIVLLEVGWRLGLPLEGVAFPHHFLVRYRGEEVDLLLDPFDGGKARAEDEAQELLDRVYGGMVRIQPAFLQPAGRRDMLIRLLNNLKTIYLNTGDELRALGVVERLLLLRPDAASERRALGMLLARMGRRDEAVDELRRYLATGPEGRERARIEEIVEQLSAGGDPEPEELEP